MSRRHVVTAIVPCSDLAASVGFYAKFGFSIEEDYGEYAILSDRKGGELHLRKSAEGWLVPGRNPFGLYLYFENVDELQAALGELVLHEAESKPWGMYELAASDPDGTLVRVGWPTKLRVSSASEA